MPIAQTLLSALNVRFSAELVSQVPPDLFETGRSLSDAVRDPRLQVHNLAGADNIADFLNQLPPAIHEGIRSVVRSALDRDPRPPVTFAWAPGYDYELCIWDTPSAQTPGGVTVLLRSRYPTDRHPLER